MAGRKCLGLNDTERKARREAQRQARNARRTTKQRQAFLASVLLKAGTLQAEGLSIKDLVTRLAEDGDIKDKIKVTKEE